MDVSIDVYNSVYTTYTVTVVLTYKKPQPTTKMCSLYKIMLLINSRQ